MSATGKIGKSRHRVRHAHFQFDSQANAEREFQILHHRLQLKCARPHSQRRKKHVSRKSPISPSMEIFKLKLIQFQNQQSNCHIPLKCDEDAVRLINETFVALRQFIKPKLNLIRGYLTMLRLQDFDMNPQDKEMIQKDFIEMRRSFNANADDLHSMLILSRLLGIINGKTTLDKECWSQAKQMDQERRHRISNLQKK